MEIRINKSAITQYLLIYLMFIIPGSCLFAKYWTGTMKYFVLLIVYVALIAFKNKYQSRYSICFLLLLLFFTVFSRFLVGGVGLSAWCQFAVCILSTQIAICCDRENFLNRWIHTVEFFAAISIGFWAVFCIAPNLVNLWPAQSYDTQDGKHIGMVKEYFCIATWKFIPQEIVAFSLNQESIRLF